MTSPSASPDTPPPDPSPVAPRATSLPPIYPLLVLAFLGLVLRWYRLDLISFRYDVADALFRARETLALGHPPLTGIVNSLGFRNPGGLIWIILPPVLLSPRPEMATAWVGLLTLTGLWPLFQIGRRWLPPGVWLLPCAAYAFLPSQVFGGRAVWAQNLMPAAGAWALWWLLTARDASRTPQARGRAATAALAILGVSVSVHLSGAATLIAALLLLIHPLRRGLLPRAALPAAAAALVLSAAILLPSFLDWRRTRHHPLPKPEHVVKFESNLPPPPSAPERVREAVSGQFGLLSSLDSLGGIERELGPAAIVPVRAADLGLFLLALVGIGHAVLLLIRGQGNNGVPETPDATAAPSGPNRSAVRTEPSPLREPARVLIVWLTVPALLGALLIPRLNATYFAPALPAVLVLGALGVSALLPARPARLFCTAGAAFLPLAYGHLFFASLAAVDQSRSVYGLYYIPLADQERLARRFKQAGVPRGQIRHLSGDWYGRPYDYLHAEVAGAAAPRPGDPWVVMDDQLLRGRSPERVKWLEEHLPHSLGTVRYRIVPDAATASAMAQAFYALPVD